MSSVSTSPAVAVSIAPLDSSLFEASFTTSISCLTKLAAVFLRLNEGISKFSGVS